MFFKIKCFVLLLCFAPEAFNSGWKESFTFEGLPIFLTEESSDRCKSYRMSDFQKIQILYGLKVANSAFQCKFFEQKISDLKVSAFIAIDTSSGCKLFRIEGKGFLDPCSNREYDRKGLCLTENCTLKLDQVLTYIDSNETIFLKKGIELHEFTASLFNSSMSTEEKLVIAMKTNSNKTLRDILNGKNKIDVNYVDKDGYSLIEISVEMGYLKVLDFLLENGVRLNKNSKSLNNALLESLKYGSFDMAQKLLDLGIPHTGMCPKLLNEISARELLGCK